MSSNQPSPVDQAVFQRIIPTLEAQGYTVIINPAQDLLPDFLRNDQPDAIALRGANKLAIQVTSGRSAGRARHSRIGKLLAGHDDWKLHVVYAPGRADEEIVAPPTRDAIEARLPTVLTAFDASGPIAALLLGWSVFEASARFLLPHDLPHAQAPSELVEALAFRGYLTVDEADELRPLGQARNRAAHGQLDVAVTREDLARLVEITRTMIAEIAPG
jgi:hypothetical protein